MKKYKDNPEAENPYLIMGFWEFAIMSALMVALFPWSLLFCIIFYGLTETKYIIQALIHDAFKTFVAILSVAVSLCVVIGILIIIFLN